MEVQRWMNLYGPERTKERETARLTQHIDHVRTNFHRAPGNIPRNQVFCTTTHSSLQEGASARREVDFTPVDTQRSYQSASHIQLGPVGLPSHSLTKADFISKQIPQYKRHVADRTINLPDMAPRYMADRRLGTTHYQTHYDAGKTTRSSERLGIKGSKDTMQFHKTTHFKLGDHHESIQSTTGFTFRGPSPQTTLPPLSQSVPGKTKSYVFRGGDYNIASPDTKDLFTSTHMKDYRASHKPSTSHVPQPQSYSHVIPRVSIDNPVNRLRKMLIERNKDAFTNPRDPTSVNVVKAFTTYDQTKCGSINVEDIIGITKTFDIPFTEEDIKDLMKECGCKVGEKLDFFKFCDYLTAHTVPVKNTDEFVSSSMDSYRKTHQEQGPQQKAIGPSAIGPDKWKQSASNTLELPVQSLNSPFSIIFAKADAVYWSKGPSAEEAIFKLTDCEYQREAEFQTGTHFKLGSDRPSTRSVYGSDFETDMQGPRKANIEPRPRNSKVMHEHPTILSGTSTTRRDFIRYDAKSSKANRSQDCREFKDKQEKVTFEIGSRTNSEDEDISITMQSYRKPEHDGHLVADPPDRKDYHHLQSNRALPHPLSDAKVSEVKDNYVAQLHEPEEYSQRRGENIGERTSRDRHNKRTHFVLGSSQDLKTSETRDQFKGRKVADSDSVPAGQPSLPIQGYSLTEHSDEELSYTAGTIPGNLQQSIQRHNYLKHINPRDTLNVNLCNAFLEYDTDRSGVIRKDQLRDACKRMNVRASEREIENILANCDTKGDGLINYHEFAQSLTQVRPQATREFQGSVTSRDFVHPKEQVVSESRRKVLAKDQKRFHAQSIQSSHYFHLDHSTDKMQSVMGKDYIPPHHMQ